jgi:hypothetical protein
MANRFANAGPKGGYDAWRSTTPDDQADADEARASRQEAAAEQAANDEPMPARAGRVVAQGRYVDGEVVAATIGTVAHPEDFT